MVIMVGTGTESYNFSRIIRGNGQISDHLLQKVRDKNWTNFINFFNVLNFYLCRTDTVLYRYACNGNYKYRYL